MSFKGFYKFSALLAILFSGAKLFFAIFRGLSKKYFREIIFKSADWPRRRCCLNGFPIFSADGHLFHKSRFF